ncbi:hypothetical protein JR316_0006592 [Psilocybe cubensis]|uniref:Uncharacterized protein n=1 Tax=Psilocybe cubensis TaxID=181762 RepID=A0ACB8GW81_PSICU|nr:hypothetical protein JR316_0006592 [Psilocybe cubensis]KAH9479995.1 hypothetical protein JR316_0006592 [Psilocybe cubensis]
MQSHFLRGRPQYHSNRGHLGSSRGNYHPGLRGGARTTYTPPWANKGTPTLIPGRTPAGGPQSQNLNNHPDAVQDQNNNTDNIALPTGQATVISEHYKEYAATIRDSLVHYGIQEGLADAIITEQMFLLATELLYRLQNLEAENKRLNNNLVAYGRITKRGATEGIEESDNRPLKKATTSANHSAVTINNIPGSTLREPEICEQVPDMVSGITIPGPRHPAPKLKRDPSRDHPNPIGYRTEDEDSDDGDEAPGPDELLKRQANRQLDFDMYSGRIDNVWGVVLHPQLSPQRHNALRNTLPRHTWYSNRSNSVFTGNTAVAAMQWEQTHDNAYNPYKNPLYAVAPRGVPRNPLEVKGLIQITQDETYESWVRIEAYVLLRTLQNAAAMSVPQVHDRAMQHLDKMPMEDFTPNVKEEDWNEILLPHDFDRLRNRYSAHKNNQGMGVPLPSREQSLNVDDLALFVLMHARLGSVSPFHGVAVKLSLEVDRRSTFGQGLVRMIGPVDKAARPTFTKLFAALVSHAHRYREAIDVYNNQHPDSPFHPQDGPLYSFTRSTLGLEEIKNLGVEHVVEVLIRNRIPVAWIDHAYPFGYHYLNARITQPIPNSHPLAVYDDERLRRLDMFGVPPAIPEWDGWRQPSDDDRLRLYVIMSLEEKANPNTPGFNHYTWLRIGEPLTQRFLAFRDQSTINTQATEAPTDMASTAMMRDDDDEMADAQEEESAQRMDEDVPTEGIARLTLKKVNSI